MLANQGVRMNTLSFGPLRKVGIRDIILLLVVTFLVIERGLPALTAWAEDATTEPRIALGNAFTYQGRLENNGVPASGAFDFEFALYSVSTGGAPVATLPAPLLSVPVSNGLFTVSLDFGSTAFTGETRWLEVRWRTAGGGSFSPFPQRQEMTATPYALYAMAVGPHSHYGDAWTGSAAYRGLSVTSNSTAVGSSAVYGQTNAEFASGIQGEAPAGGVGVSGAARPVSNGGDQRAIGVVGRVCDEGPSGGCIFGDGVFPAPESGVYGESTGGNGVTGVGNWDEGGSGVYGRSSSNTGNMDNFTAGVVGESSKTGVIGFGTLVGVLGKSNSPVVDAQSIPRAAVVAKNYGTSCGNVGGNIEGYCVGTFASAVSGTAAIGVYGEGSQMGVYGYTTHQATGWALFGFGRTYTSGTYETSDQTLKTDSSESAGLDEIMALVPHSYRWAEESIDDGKRHQGLFAQEVQEVLPDLVTWVEAPGLQPHFALNYTELIPVLVRAIQQQQAQIDALAAGGPVPAPVAESAVPAETGNGDRLAWAGVLALALLGAAGAVTFGSTRS